jgi:hypothetical protein
MLFIKRISVSTFIPRTVSMWLRVIIVIVEIWMSNKNVFFKLNEKEK